MTTSPPARPVAVVTGGGTGIGRACSLALAERGHPVAVVYRRSADDAAATVADIERAGGRAAAVQADVGDDAAVRAMAAEVRDRLGRPGVLVNNAGGTVKIPYDDLEAVTDDVFDSLWRGNVLSAWYCARALADDLRSAEDGVVINIGSVAAIRGKGSSLPYTVSKAAMTGLTRALAHALAPVRVNEVAPGLVLTRWWAGEEEQGRELARSSLLDHETTPEDVAAAVIGLVASAAATGQVLPIDGGLSL